MSFINKNNKRNNEVLPKYKKNIKSTENKNEQMDKITITPEMTSPSSNTQSMNKPLILLFVDNSHNLKALHRTLTNEKYRIVVALTKKELSQHITEETFNLLIFDLTLSKKRSYNIIKHVRDQFTLLELPILMIIERFNLSSKADPFEIGVNDCLLKPWNKDELLSRIQSLLHLNLLYKKLQNINLLLDEKVKQLTAQLKRLQESSTSKEQLQAYLLANLAHELGTPVTVLQNYLQAVHYGYLDEKEQKHYIEVAFDKLTFLNKLIIDLFELSKLETKQTRFHFRKRLFFEWLEHLEQKLKTEMMKKGHAINFVKTEVQEDMYCLIDGEQLERAFLLLLEKLISSPSLKERKIELSINISRFHKYFLFRFVASGLSLNKCRLPHLLAQQDIKENIPKRVDQLGIKLAIVKKIVQAHEGEIWVNNKRNLVYRYFITLPFHTLQK